MSTADVVALPTPGRNWRSEESGTLSREKLDGLRRVIQEAYLADSRPWIVGYSGGKDSTTALQVCWDALSRLEASQLSKPIYVICSDTLVENPIMLRHSQVSLGRMNEAGRRAGLPLTAKHVRPKPDQTFWVNLIGRGYPAPYNRFRWCTDRMKIDPANEFIKTQVDRHGEVVLVLGVRRSESATRRQVMELYKRHGDYLSRHSKLTNAWVFTPIEDWDLKDVWQYLLNSPNPWGNNNRDLVAIYKNADGECPLVVDRTTPSCGNSRFGCWTCTVVARDKSLEAAVDNGDEWMEPMLDFRDWLKSTAEPSTKGEYRSHRRRSGRVDKWGKKGEDKNKLIWGPYLMEVRQLILRKLLAAQLEARRLKDDESVELIADDELREIRRLWRTEEGDWGDSVPAIFREVTGEELPVVEDAAARGTVEEAELLAQVAGSHNLPIQMLKDLIDVQRDYRGVRRRSKLQQRLDGVLGKDWRTAEEVFAELEDASQSEWTAGSTHPPEVEA